MSKLKEADFYYGAVLSNLINNHICPALIEGGSDRQVYDFTTDEKDFRLFVKYRSASIKTKTEDYTSWQFVFSDADIQELREYCGQDSHFSLGLICGESPMNQSQYAVLHKEEILQLLEWGKSSITLSIKKGEHAFRLSVGGGRDNAMQIPANRKY
jgi:hypothetical protein